VAAMKGMRETGGKAIFRVLSTVLVVVVVVVVECTADPSKHSSCRNVHQHGHGDNERCVGRLQRKSRCVEHDLPGQRSAADDLQDLRRRRPNPTEWSVICLMTNQR